MSEATQPCRLMAEKRIKNGQIAVRQQTIVNYPLHWHNFFEIELIIDGSGYHIYNGVQYPIAKGDAYILTPIDFHEMRSTEHLTMINIGIHETCLPENILMYLSMPNTSKTRKLREDEMVRFTMAANLLAYECENQGICTRQLLEYLLSFLCNGETQKLKSI